MPEPISSHSPPNACLPSDEEPLMSLDPSQSGGMSVAPPPAPKPTPGGPVSVPLAPISLASGAKVLVIGHTTISAKGALGVLAPSVAGNLGVRAAVAEASITVTSSSTGASMTLQGALGSSELDVGTKNADGSSGAHVKVAAALASGEVTLNGTTTQTTFGADYGRGLEASSGVRDSDGDGNTEYCLRAGTSLVGGLCIEPGQIIDDLKGAAEVLKRVVTAPR